MISAISTWSRGPCRPSTIRSARDCHPCLRYVPSPMSPGRTPRKWQEWRKFHFSALSTAYVANSTLMALLTSNGFLANCQPARSHHARGIGRHLKMKAPGAVGTATEAKEVWRHAAARNEQRVVASGWSLQPSLTARRPSRCATDASPVALRRLAHSTEGSWFALILGPFTGQAMKPSYCLNLDDLRAPIRGRSRAEAIA